MEEKKGPLGVLILGSINCYFFGLLLFTASILSYLTTSEEAFYRILPLFENRGLGVGMTYQNFKTANLLQAAVSVIFFLSGFGLLKKREWARKLTIYFSLVWALVYVGASIIYPPSIKYLTLQFLYFGGLIFYFTNKKVEQYFREQDSNQ